MPGENIQDWSTTAASNGTADSAINWAEGMARAAVNNSARSMMAAIAKDRNLKNGSITTGGAANAQTFSSGLAYVSVPTGLVVVLKIGAALTNTTTASLNMDGIGAVTIKTIFGNDLVGGELVAGAYAYLIYNGTNWVLINPSFNGQLAFPAAQLASSNANTLDDYEEGTWTPSLTFGGGSTGITYSAQTGSYTKIGRIVNIQMRMALTNKGSSTGAAQISGLPFTSASLAFPLSIDWSGFSLSTGTAQVQYSAVVDSAGTNIKLYESVNGGSISVTQLTNTYFTNTSTLQLAGHYHV